MNNNWSTAMRRMILATACLALAIPALASGTATVGITSPVNGKTISAGADVDWTITLSLTSGDNFGLALVSVDLVQDDGNPVLFNIPQANGVPAAMADFSRPDGISNSDPNDPSTSFYVGTPIGINGAKNLIQIGGGQNTFGAPGVTMGLDYNVDGSIGHTPVIIAQGSFAAPATAGTYTYRLTNIVANALDELNTPPDFCAVSAATTVASPGSISFTVVEGCPNPGGSGDFCTADVYPNNGDGVWNYADDGDCIVDLSDLSQLLGAYGMATGATREDGDIYPPGTGDGAVNLQDLSELLGQYGDDCN